MTKRTTTEQDRMSLASAGLGSAAAPRRILDKLGWWRMGWIIWRATPWPWRAVAFPYSLVVYRRLFAASDTLRYLHAMHARQYDNSRLFRLVRPRYRAIEHLLRKSGVTE